MSDLALSRLNFADSYRLWSASFVGASRLSNHVSRFFASAFTFARCDVGFWSSAVLIRRVAVAYEQRYNKWKQITTSNVSVWSNDQLLTFKRANQKGHKSKHLYKFQLLTYTIARFAVTYELQEEVWLDIVQPDRVLGKLHVKMLLHHASMVERIIFNIRGKPELLKIRNNHYVQREWL